MTGELPRDRSNPAGKGNRFLWVPGLRVAPSGGGRYALGISQARGGSIEARRQSDPGDTDPS